MWIFQACEKYVIDATFEYLQLASYPSHIKLAESLSIRDSKPLDTQFSWTAFSLFVHERVKSGLSNVNR